MSEQDVLLDVKNLNINFKSDFHTVTAVEDVSFKVRKKEIVAVVGESGSGKSVTANTIMRLNPPNGEVSNGSILYKGKNLVEATTAEMRSLRGNDISMIFQEPMSSLNPLFTIGQQMDEAIRVHDKTSKKEAKKRSIEALERVRIPRAKEVYKSYPHSLSGGMRQRVMIAMALSSNPSLLIADEPTTALDVTIQAQILRIMKDLHKEESTSIIFITHDLGVVAEMADRVIVMYAGRVVEENNVYELFNNPKHPYTKGLLESTIDIDQGEEELVSIKGTVPSPANLPSGCVFHPRCPVARDICSKKKPRQLTFENNSRVNCWLFDDKLEEEEDSGFKEKEAVK